MGDGKEGLVARLVLLMNNLLDIADINAPSVTLRKYHYHHITILDTSWVAVGAHSA